MSHGRSDRELTLSSRAGGGRVYSYPQCYGPKRVAPSLPPQQPPAPRSLPPRIRAASGGGAHYAGASLPWPPLAPASPTLPRLPHPRSCRGWSRSRKERWRRRAPSSARPAGGAPLSLAKAGADGPPSPREAAPPPSPPDAANRPPWSPLVPGSGVVTPPKSLHWDPPPLEIPSVPWRGIASVHVQCHGRLGGARRRPQPARLTSLVTVRHHLGEGSRVFFCRPADDAIYEVTGWKLRASPCRSDYYASPW